MAILVSLAPAGLLTARAEQPQRTITIQSRKYVFEPAEITLRKGETVKVVLQSQDVPHGLAVPGIGLHLDASKEKPAEALVTPDVTGDFAGKCSRFCGTGHRDMRFAVHVTQ